VVNGHPDEHSFSAALAREYVNNLDQSKHQVETLELGKMRFDPVLRFGYRERMEPDAEIARSQELILWADHLVFFSPIWWGTVPSLLKGWFDRVLTPGVAFDQKGTTGVVKRLAGKTAHLVFTSHFPVPLQILSGDRELKGVKKSILGFCGVRTTRVDRLGFLLGTKGEEERRARFLQKVGRSAGEV
jgi:putative NADPH-quinone reductase